MIGKLLGSVSSVKNVGIYLGVGAGLALVCALALDNARQSHQIKQMKIAAESQSMILADTLARNVRQSDTIKTMQVVNQEMATAVAEANRAKARLTREIVSLRESVLHAPIQQQNQGLDPFLVGVLDGLRNAITNGSTGAGAGSPTP
ncbi:MAG: hypothetical protein ACRCUB_10985 [Plesiomonas shigelloides]